MIDMIMKEGFLNNDAVLLITSDEAYQKSLSVSLKNMDKIFNKICYFSFTKNGKTIARLLEREKIDAAKFSIIQTVSDSEKIVNSFFAGKPNELTKISISYTSVLDKTKPECVFNDSVSTLFIYQDENSTLRFIISLINKTRDLGIKIVFLVTMNEKFASSIKELYMYFDKIIDLRKDEWK